MRSLAYDFKSWLRQDGSLILIAGSGLMDHGLSSQLVPDILSNPEESGNTYRFDINEYKSSYYPPYFLQLGAYCYTLFSHDAEILTKLPIEEKLKNLSLSGVVIERGCLTLLRKIKNKVDTEKLVDYIIEKEKMLTASAIRRVYAAGTIKDKPSKMPSAVGLYPFGVSVDVTITGKLIVSNGDVSEFPVQYCRNNELMGFGQSVTRALEKRLKSLRDYHRALSLYELDNIPYCRECGPNGERCHYPEYCLVHPPGQKAFQLHFSAKTGKVVRSGPARII